MGTFYLFDYGKTEIVSEVVIKLEFLIRLPDLANPQRYVINIDVDSKLPVVLDDEDSREYGLLRWFARLETIPSLTVSVDFVDYLCAKNFVQIVEDWFHSLEESPRSKWRARMSNVPFTWRYVFSRFSNIGAAAFIALYAYLKGGDLGSATQIVYLGAVAIVVWTLSNLLCVHMGYLFETTISRSFVPASIILTTGDERGFKKVQDRARTMTPKIICHLAATGGSLFVNVLASFIYAWLTR